MPVGRHDRGAWRRAINTEPFDTAPTGGCARIISFSPTYDIFTIQRPNEDNQENTVIVGVDMPFFSVGYVWIDGIHPVKWDGVGTVAMGDRLGSKSGSWEFQKCDGGFYLVRAYLAAQTLPFATWTGLGLSEVFLCQLVDDGGTQVLKKYDPSTGTTSDFTIDISEVYESVTHNALNSVSYPNDTIFVVYRDAGSRHYFVHPFYFYRPYSV
jgi:hypothetical protein